MKAGGNIHDDFLKSNFLAFIYDYYFFQLISERGKLIISQFF